MSGRNVYKIQTAISKIILNTVPNRYEFDKYQEKRIACAFAEDMVSKVKFTWSEDGLLDAKILKGEVAVLHVDEYKELLKQLDDLADINREYRRMYYTGGWIK